MNSSTVLIDAMNENPISFIGLLLLTGLILSIIFTILNIKREGEELVK